jgi:hypothetical protein
MTAVYKYSAILAYPQPPNDSLDSDSHVLEPLLKEIESLNEGIKEYDARMEKIAVAGGEVQGTAGADTG